jgi:hypothetical protein
MLLHGIVAKTDTRASTEEALETLAWELNLLTPGERVSCNEMSRRCGLSHHTVQKYLPILLKLSKLNPVFEMDSKNRVRVVSSTSYVQHMLAQFNFGSLVLLILVRRASPHHDVTEATRDKMVEIHLSNTEIDDIGQTIKELTSLDLLRIISHDPLTVKPTEEGLEAAKAMYEAFNNPESQGLDRSRYLRLMQMGAMGIGTALPAASVAGAMAGSIGLGLKELINRRKASQNQKTD